MVKHTTILYVFMNGSLVGELTQLRSGGLTFKYLPQWLEQPEARPISLSLPLTSMVYEDQRVYHFFDNLLPDNMQIRVQIQTLFHASSRQPFDLLYNIGHDCVGAIQLCHNDEAANVKLIKAELLDDQEIAYLLKNYQQAPLGMVPDHNEFRISIAGAQQKTALLLQKGQWYRPLGTTPTSHIFKLPIGIIEHQNIDLSDSCENEWLCCKIAEAFDLPVAPANICCFEDVKVLVVQRFDRQISQDNTWLMRLPQEDLCQALGYSPALKYQADGGPGNEAIMSLLLGSEQASVDRERFYRSQILFWLLAALDGHAKNFSIFIGPSGRFRLTPLYDILSAYPLLANGQLQKQKIKMAMALKSTQTHYHWYTIQRRHFLAAADAMQFAQQTATYVLNDMLEQVESVITTVSQEIPSSFPSSIAEPIFAGMIDFRNKMKQ